MFKKLNTPTDMTKGAPWKSIIAFTLPMLIGNIAQQLYSTVDSIVVGQYVGDNALAAVGSALPILNMLLVLFMGISSGANVMVSQYVGAKNREAISHTVGTSIIVTLVSCAALMIFATPLIMPVLKLQNTPDSIINDCYWYLFISLMGIAGMGYYNILSGILRGLGDSFSALIYLLVATGINIALDIYFVAELGMGVSGVALATIIAQFVSSALCVIKLSRMKEYFDFNLYYLKPKAEYAKRVISLGIPAGLTQAIFSSAINVISTAL